jgi:hypothetical protein
MTHVISANGASNIPKIGQILKLALVFAWGLNGGALAQERRAAESPAETKAPAPEGPQEPRPQPVEVVLEPGIRLPIAEQVPLNIAEWYLLEVAKDPGFGQIVLKAEVHGAALAWDAPGEGVYHWRLAKLKKKNLGADVVTFVSGSVVGFQAKTKREKPARLSWSPAPGADRYKIVFTDTTGKITSVTSQKTEYVIPDSTASGAIEIIPYTGGRRTFRDFHFNPSLKLDGGLPPPPPPAPVVAPLPGPAPEAPRCPEPKIEVTPTTAEVQPASRHLIHLYGLYGRDDLTLSKLELRLSNQDNFAGFGGRIWTQPTEAFVVSAEGAGYRQAASLTQPDVLSDKSVSLDLWRYTGHALLGINILSPFSVRDHVLVASAGGALTRLPFLPEKYSLTSDQAPELTELDRPLLGGGLTYGWFGEYVALIVEGSRFMDQTGAGTLTEGRGILQFRVADGFYIDLGGIGRLTQLETCATDQGQCLSEGKVTTQSLETGGTFGLSARM